MFRTMDRAACLVAALLPLPALAIDPEAFATSGWWGGIDLGYASITRKYDLTGQSRQYKPTAALRGGYAPIPSLLLGVEAAGWLLEGGNLLPSNEREGIETLSLVAQYYPLPEPLFVRAGIGATRYWDRRSQESGGAGSGKTLAIGYDVRLQGIFYFTPSVDFSWGHIHGATSPAGVTQDQNYRAVSFRIGLSFR
jgi:hypothetical protein